MENQKRLIHKRKNQFVLKLNVSVECFARILRYIWAVFSLRMKMWRGKSEKHGKFVARRGNSTMLNQFIVGSRCWKFQTIFLLGVELWIESIRQFSFLSVLRAKGTSHLQFRCITCDCVSEKEERKNILYCVPSCSRTLSVDHSQSIKSSLEKSHFKEAQERKQRSASS